MTTQVNLVLKAAYDPLTVNKVFKKATTIMEEILLQSGIESGRFNLIPRRKLTWTAGKNHSIRLRMAQGHEIRVVIKCRGGGECWEYSLIPSNNSIQLDHVLQHLEASLGKPGTDSDDTENGEVELGKIPMPTPDRNGKHMPAPIESPPILAPLVPTPAVSPLVILDKLRDAINRRDSRVVEIEQVRRQLATVDAEIDRLTAEKDKLLMKILELEEANANDKDAKAADQISQLLGQFS